MSTYELRSGSPTARRTGRRPWRRWARCGHDRRPRPAHRPLRRVRCSSTWRLHQAAAVLPSWLDRAAAQELSYSDFLHGLLEEEAVARASAATRRRLREADFPYAATIEQFDFRFRPELKRQLVLRYLDPTFVEQARSLALIGRRAWQDDARRLHRDQARPPGCHRSLHHRPAVSQPAWATTSVGGSASCVRCSPATCWSSMNWATCPPHWLRPGPLRADRRPLRAAADPDHLEQEPDRLGCDRPGCQPGRRPGRPHPAPR